MVFVSLTENSSVITNDTIQEIAVGTHIHEQHGTKNCHSIFSSWWKNILITTAKISLFTIRQHSATRKTHEARLSFWTPVQYFNVILWSLGNLITQQQRCCPLEPLGWGVGHLHFYEAVWYSLICYRFLWLIYHNKLWVVFLDYHQPVFLLWHNHWKVERLPAKTKEPSLAIRLLFIHIGCQISNSGTRR